MTTSQISQIMKPTGVTSHLGVDGITVASNSLCPIINKGTVAKPIHPTQGLKRGDLSIATPSPKVQKASRSCPICSPMTTPPNTAWLRGKGEWEKGKKKPLTLSL
jgi:hypothetical protein